MQHSQRLDAVPHLLFLFLSDSSIYSRELSPMSVGEQYVLQQQNQMWFGECATLTKF